MLRGQVLQGGNNSILCPVYPLIHQQLHGPPDRACHFKTFYDHSSIYRNDTATKRAAMIRDDLDVATASKNKGKH